MAFVTLIAAYSLRYLFDGAGSVDALSQTDEMEAVILDRHPSYLAAGLVDIQNLFLFPKAKMCDVENGHSVDLY